MTKITMKTTRRAAICMAMTLATPHLPFAYATSTEISEITQALNAFFIEESPSDLADYVAGEIDAKEPNFRSHMPSEMSVAYRPLAQTPDFACYGVTITIGNESEDWYAYLKPSGRWKITAIRRLFFPKVFADGIREVAEAPFATEKDRHEANVLKLILAADKNLKEHFQKHKADMETILRNVQMQILSGRAPPQLDTELPDTLRAMVSDCKVDEQGRILLFIGGAIDNFVGYMFVSMGKAPPEISPSLYIMIEAITPGWYLFKTT